MTISGQALTEVKLPKGTVQTGVEYEPVAPGLVTQMEERDTAAGARIPWTQWTRMERHERVSEIAFRRTKRMVELHQNAAVEKESGERRELGRAAQKRKR